MVDFRRDRRRDSECQKRIRDRNAGDSIETEDFSNGAGFI